MPTDTEARYGLTWRVTPDLLGVLNPSGLFEATNPAWHSTLGYTADEIESRQFFDFVHPGDIAATRAAFVDIKQGKPILKFENRYRHKNGEYRWLSWNCVPEGGKFYCSARDITQAMENQAALATRDEEARFREQFIAVLGHDLRNPVAAFRSALTMLRKQEQTERSLAIIDAGEKSVRRMLELIEDMMDFARTRLGSGLSLDLSDSAELESAIRAAVEELRIVHPGRAIGLEFALERPVCCDAGRIGQLVSNLVSNAITHGNSDEPVLVHARTGDGSLFVSVTNSGTPITEDVKLHLFEPFVREQVRPSQEGLGLGLFICAEIARAHGGRIDVRSDAKETCFELIMPLSTAGQKLDD